MILTTKRLTLRPWQDSDAAALYEFAKDPRVGPAAGWPVHKSQVESLEVLRSVLIAPETYAVVLNAEDRVVGSAGIKLGEQSQLLQSAAEGEIGYWVGVPYWGRGIMPEAVEALLRHGFLELKLTTLWCGYYDGNEKSHRVMEKCGFTHHHTIENSLCTLLGETRTEHITCLTRAEWEARHV